MGFFCGGERLVSALNTRKKWECMARGWRLECYASEWEITPRKHQGYGGILAKLT